MSQPPSLPRRSVLIGGVSFGAAAVAGASPVSASDPLDRDIAAAVSACYAAESDAAREQDDTPEHAIAEARADAADQVLRQLSEDLFARPITSLRDCVSYARLLDLHQGIPHPDDLAKIRDRAEQASGYLTLKLLEYAKAPRIYEPPSWAEQDRCAAAQPVDEDAADPEWQHVFDTLTAAMGGRETLADFAAVSCDAIDDWRERGFIPTGWHLRIWIECQRVGAVIDPARLFDLSPEDGALLVGKGAANG